MDKIINRKLHWWLCQENPRFCVFGQAGCSKPLSQQQNLYHFPTATVISQLQSEPSACPSHAGLGCLIVPSRSNQKIIFQPERKIS